MGTPAEDRLGADEQLVRATRGRARRAGAAHGIHELRFASAGRLLGRVDDDRDLLDMAEFAATAEQLLAAPVLLLSDAVLDKPNVSADLVHAGAL